MTHLSLGMAVAALILSTLTLWLNVVTNKRRFGRYFPPGPPRPKRAYTEAELFGARPSHRIVRVHQPGHGAD